MSDHIKTIEKVELITKVMGQFVESILGPKCNFAFVLFYHNDPESIAVSSDIEELDTLVAVLRNATKEMSQQSTKPH